MSKKGTSSPLSENTHIIRKKERALDSIQVEGKLYILRANKNSFIELNKVGNYVWKLIKYETSVDIIISEVLKHFRLTKKDIPRVRKDVLNFLKSLEHYNLIEIKKVKS